MQVTFGRRLLVWVGKKGSRPTTYADLVAAEKRTFEVEEKFAILAEEFSGRADMCHMGDGGAEYAYRCAADAVRQTLRDLNA